ncbi:MAG TPA: hypothetical protein VHW00_05810 [Thermoanaerobaculia bacterium]|nr:hypothetical protein [Thermoanaerobaculia bacterium]
MATEKKTTDAAAAEATAATPPPLWSSPIRMEREKKRKKRKKYSRGTKGFQRLFLGFASAIEQGSKGVRDGARTWVRRSKRSSRKKKDGLIRDAFSNATRAISKGGRKIAKAPEEISKRFNTRRGWRMIRVATPF